MKLRHPAYALTLLLIACGDGSPVSESSFEEEPFRPVRILAFQSGDNAYVELSDDGEPSTRRTLLCTAPVCFDWRDEGSLPPVWRGALADARFGTTDQTDDAGNVMNEDVETVTELRFVSAADR